MLDAVTNAKYEIANEDVDKEPNGDLAKEVFPQVADEEEDDESEQDEETGDKNCNRVEDARKPLSCQTRPAKKLSFREKITEFAKKVVKIGENVRLPFVVESFTNIELGM